MFSKIKRSRILKWGSLLFLGFFALGLLFFLSIYAGVWGKLPSSEELSQLKQSRASQVLSSEGELIGKFFIDDRQPVALEAIPEHLVQALIATEDIRFFDHNGIDYRSLGRVLVKTLLLQDESSGGGSTLSLQLAKNIYGRKDYGPLGILVNKVQEAIIATRLEKVHGKREIIRLYLNTVPFGDNTFGIESAAMKFFAKPTAALEVEESAVLIGMLKASHFYNPRIFPERSKTRRNVVLRQMEKYGYLDSLQAETAIEKDLILDYRYYGHDKGLAPYFREQVRKKITRILDTLKNKEGKKYNIYRDGLIVHTTLDFRMQELAEEAMREHMAKLQARHEASYGSAPPWKEQPEIIEDAIKNSRVYKKLQQEGLSSQQITAALEKEHPMELFEYDGAVTRMSSMRDSIIHYLKFLNAGMLAVEPGTGAVKAWVGGIDFRYFKYDHVSQSRRQVGSTFKPIVYTAALEQGVEPCTYFSAREVTYAGGWRPSNSNSEPDDPFMNYSMKEALSKSMNTIAVKVLMEAGINNVLEQARKMGISSHLPAVPSIALGTASLSLQELTTAFTTYANGGRYSKPFLITRIEDGAGNLLTEFQPGSTPAPAYSETNRQLLLEMMKATVNEGTAIRLRTVYGLSNDIAGKTGTTQDNKDGWFVGLTPNLVTVTWVGADDHRIGFRNTAIGQGANSALPIFAKLMQKMNAEPRFRQITGATFPIAEAVREMLDCESEKKDHFFQRLFGKKASDTPPRKPESKKKEKKKGFFQRLFGGKKKKN